MRRRADEIHAIAAEHVDVEVPLPRELRPLVRLVTEAVLRELLAALEEDE